MVRVMRSNEKRRKQRTEKEGRKWAFPERFASLLLVSRRERGNIGAFLF